MVGMKNKMSSLRGLEKSLLYLDAILLWEPILVSRCDVGYVIGGCTELGNCRSVRKVRR